MRTETLSLTCSSSLNASTPSLPSLTMRPAPQRLFFLGSLSILILSRLGIPTWSLHIPPDTLFNSVSALSLQIPSYFCISLLIDKRTYDTLTTVLSLPLTHLSNFRHDLMNMSFFFSSGRSALWNLRFCFPWQSREGSWAPLLKPLPDLSLWFDSALLFTSG